MMLILSIAFSLISSIVVIGVVVTLIQWFLSVTVSMLVGSCFRSFSFIVVIYKYGQCHCQCQLNI